MGDHNGKVGIEQKIYILPQNREKKNFVFLASSEHKVFFSLYCGKKYTFAVSSLLQFSRSYLCELGFSTLNNIKTKKRERLHGIEKEMLVSLSELRPNIEKVAKKNQAQISHWLFDNNICVEHIREYCIHDKSNLEINV